VGKPLILIVDADLSTRALVEASVDVDVVALKTARDVETAREVLDLHVPAITLLAEDLEAAGELMAELAGQPVLWLGSADRPEAQLAAQVLSKPLDILTLQRTLEGELGTAPPVVEGRPYSAPKTEDVAFRAIEAERDALLAEVAVMRHERAESRRHQEDAVEASRESLHATVTQLRAELAEALTALDARRKTAEALQAAYGEVQQAHGKLHQQHEALEAECEAMSERARDVSILREQLEMARRDHARERAELEARLDETSTRAAEAARALGLRAAEQGDLAGLVEEAGWWQEALQEATD